MVTAAKTISQVFTHIGIAFAIAYWVTGSLVFGGLAALLEPLINVAVLPFHQRFWSTLRANKQKAEHAKLAFVLAEKASQLLMHMLIAFGVIFWATGSLVFGGLAALLEPVCNVLLLPFHDQAWEKFREKLRLRIRHPFMTA